MYRSRRGVRTGLAAAFCFVVFVAGIPSQAHASIPPGSRDAWLALLHYWRSGETWVSEIEDPSFFLDAAGSRDPEREWDADLRGFLAPAENVPAGTHAQCRFPARFSLMKQALGWLEKDVSIVDCPEFSASHRQIGATSVSVAFVSYYLNNPASAFGHTMLYLGSGGDRGAVLADYSVSFEANTDGMSPVQYLPRGLLGGLDARYQLAPLYERAHRYEREEQRDLWLFQLRVSQEVVDQLVRHLWELKDVSFRYGFFEGNCAQKILAVVHAVAPAYEVLPYQRSAVLPSEVAKRLVEKVGLVGGAMRRPSLWSQYNSQITKLSPQEKEQLETMVSSRTVVAGASPATLSAALLWSEFETPDRAFRRAADTTDAGALLWKRALWTARVAEGTGIMVPDSSLESEPALMQSHGSSRFSLLVGVRRGSGSVVSGSARWLLHEAIDPHAAYPPVSSIEVGRIDAGVSATGKVFLDDATLLRVERLAPVSRLQSALAWKFELGARRLAQEGNTPLHVGAEVGVGVGAARLRPSYSVAVYSLWGARPGVARVGGSTSFLPAGIWSGGILLRLPADFRARVSGEYTLSLRELHRGGGMVKTVLRKSLMRNWDLEFAATLAPRTSSAALGFVSFR